MPFSTVFWRWRRNPLRRGSDVAESWLVLATGVLIAVAAPGAGVAATHAADAGAHERSQGWHSVSVVVTENPPAVIGIDSPGVDGGKVQATVRWTRPDGTVRTGQTAVPTGLGAGDRTTAWLDGHGTLLRHPLTPGEVHGEGIALGATAASGTCLIALGAERAGVALLNHRRYAQWEREWAEADPQRGHKRT
ncbi:Rv1733c family protein [Streptomyces celluloflavus]|uniref:Rv1733c family protein n=1 Tax=Streptomyces celluloflavus TaxID=58344 RepID=UPI003686D407